MALILFAQPYDVTANGFYFGSFDAYCAQATKQRNAQGTPVEEYEIQFIDGAAIDCSLGEAIGLSQATLELFFDIVDDGDVDEKIRVILAVGECGHSFDAKTCPCDFDLEIHACVTMRELAEQFVDEGLYGVIPERLEFYIDYEAIARDLSMDYAEAEIAGIPLVYRCG